jgi:hypothetical protein
MADTTVSTVQELLKYAYGQNRVSYLFNKESVTWAILSKVKKPVGGRGQFIIPILTQNAGGFTGQTEGGAIPTALAPDTTEATFSLVEYVGSAGVTWKLIQDARNDKFAFQQAVSMIDESVQRRIMRNLNSDLIGTGKGELATLTGVDASGAIITSAYMPRCEQGMVVDVMDLSDDDTKIGDSRTVDSVDYVARTVNLSGADLSGEAAGDYLVIQDTCDDSLNNSLHSHGLLGIVSDSNPAAVVGNYGGINRSTAGNEFWQAVQLDNSGTNRAFTEDLGLQAQDAAREKGSGRLKLWLSNQRVARRYHETLRAESYAAFGNIQALGKGSGLGRSGSADKPAEDGRTIYEFSGIPWHVDPYFTNNVILGLDTDHLFIGVGDQDVPLPVNEIFDGTPMFRQTTNTAWEMVWYYQMQLLSDNPAASVRIDDIAEA